MKTPSSYPTVLATTLMLLMAPLLSGCTLLGLGAAAGATVGGCALLDDNQDGRLTEAEFSAGLFDAWDTDDDGTVSQAEFAAGTQTSDAYAGWSGSFDAWDDNSDGTLSQAEFTDGATGSGDVTAMLDDACDDLGL